MKEHWRRVLENTVLRKIFGSEEDYITNCFMICTPDQWTGRRIRTGGGFW
jgi:hypothetical protein